MHCPSCSTELRTHSRACDACGVLLPQSHWLSDAVDMTEHRLLTVVFSELVSSTQLSQQLDPEDMDALLDAYQRECTLAIEHCGGYVAQHLGSGILAYFGYPNTQPDDARRGVEAAMAVLDAVSRIAAPASVRSVEARVGVHTGSAVVGTLGAGHPRENLALGDTPNLAARIQVAADPNTVVISHATQRLVQGLFRCEPLDRKLLSAGGPIELHRVLSMTSATRSVGAASAMGLTPFMDRTVPLTSLKRLWERSLCGRFQSVLVVGEAGIGKSRLAHVLKHRVGSDAASVVDWQCAPEFQNTSLHPVAEALARQLGVRQGAPPAVRLADFERALSELALTGEVGRFLAPLVSLARTERHAAAGMSPQLLRRHTFDALEQWVRALASRQPLLLVIEDVHWADASTLELIGRLREQLQLLPVLMLMTARPEFRLPWDDAAWLVRLHLEPLPPAEVTRMIRDLARGLDLPAKVSDELAQRSQGIPLFIEELTRALIASGGAAGQWAWERGAPQHPELVSCSIQASLAARLDRMGDCKWLAQVASALGQSFSYEMLLAVHDVDGETLWRDLRALCNAGLLHVLGEPPDADCAFKHALIRELVYDSTARKARRELHAKIANVLLERYVETAQTRPELIAFHFAEAGEPGRAVPYWLAAGQRALGRSANHESVNCLTRGLLANAELPDGLARTSNELTMRVMLAPALMAIKGSSHADVLENYTRARQLVSQLEDAPQMFGVLWGLWAQHFVAGQLIEARPVAEQVVRMAHATDNPDWIPPAHNALGFVECYSARYEETVALVEQALSLFELERERKNTLHFQFASSIALINMGATALFMLGKPDQARALAARARPLAEQLGHPPSMAFAITSSTWLLQLAGDAESVIEAADLVIELCKNEGFEFWPPLVRMFAGWARMAAGEHERGAEIIRQAFSEYRASGGGILRTHAFALLADGLLKAGRDDEALATVDEAIANAHASGEVHFEPELHRIRGLCLLERARKTGEGLDEAQAALERAVELAHRQKAYWLELRAAIWLARLLHARGESARARQYLAPAHARIREGHGLREMVEAGALLGDLLPFSRSEFAAR